MDEANPEEVKYSVETILNSPTNFTFKELIVKENIGTGKGHIIFTEEIWIIDTNPYESEASDARGEDEKYKFERAWRLLEESREKEKSN